MRINPDCVVKVGDGRGFIIKQRLKVTRPKGPRKSIPLMPFVENRLVVTAAHCLPHWPVAIAGGTGCFDQIHKALLLNTT